MEPQQSLGACGACGSRLLRRLGEESAVTSETSRSNLGTAALADRTTGRIPKHTNDARPEAREAARANFGRAALADATLGILEDVCFEARETARAEFGVAALADTTSRVVERARSEAREAHCSELGVALLANVAAAVEAIHIARHATRANFLVAPTANATPWRVPEVINHLCDKTCKAPRANLGIAILANTATVGGVEIARHAEPAKFLVTTVAADATPIKLVHIASEATCADLCVALTTNTTPRRIPEAVNGLII